MGRLKSGPNHGLGKTPEYGVWCGLVSRCTNPDNPHYGGRGIKVCDRWLTSPRNFYEDMGPRPSPRHEIDRENVNGDYTPENCRWVTKVEQRRNMRSNIIIEYNGERKTAIEWANQLGIKHGTILYRFHKGWPVEKILFGTLCEKPLITHCPQGHEYSPENTKLYGGRRHCYTCMRAREKARGPRKRRRT